MAQMMPDKIPGASVGEKRLFSIFQNLPDDYIVYYEPIVKNRYPDFILICPDLGLMVVEEKGWRPKHILAANPKEITLLERDNSSVKRLHPLEQARKYKFSLMDACREHPAFKELLVTTRGNQYEGRFIFPFGHFAVLSNITSKQLKEHKIGNLGIIFPPSKIITRDGLETLEQLSSDEFRNKLESFFDPFWKIDRLNERQVDIIRAVVHPELSSVFKRPAPEIEEDDDDSGKEASSAALSRNKAEKESSSSALSIDMLTADIKILDLKQETHARQIGEGHRLVFGVAGSGKTILLIYRATLLAKDNPEFKILVLCYNVVLASYLKGCLSEYDNVSVFHFDGWAIENGVKRRFKEKETDQKLGLRLLKELESKHGEVDAVLIDEAQDFHPLWFKCVLEAMIDPNDGDLLIVGDGNQGLYPQGTVSWNKLGINAQGRTYSKKFDLDKNYRNSKEIVELAVHFASSSKPEDDHGILSATPDPAKTLRSINYKPILIQCIDRERECQQIIKIVKSWLDGNKVAIKNSEIGILYPRIEKAYQEIFKQFLSQLEEYTSVIWLSDRDDYNARTRINEPGIKVQTIHSSKGLQYRAVILMWADLLPSRFSDDEDSDRRLMYVGITRPEDYLVITYSGKSPFIDEINNPDKVTIYKCQK
jgi:hypothetical protein